MRRSIFKNSFLDRVPVIKYILQNSINVFICSVFFFVSINVEVLRKRRRNCNPTELALRGSSKFDGYFIGKQISRNFQTKVRIIEETVVMPDVLLLSVLPLTEKRCSYFSSERTRALVTSTMELGQFHILQDDASTTLAS